MGGTGATGATADSAEAGIIDDQRVNMCFLAEDDRISRELTLTT